MSDTQAMLAAITLLLGIFIAVSLRILIPYIRWRREQARFDREVRAVRERLGAAFEDMPRMVPLGTIPKDSELGRLLSDVLSKLPCQCPDCEEERRIAHAAEQAQKPGEQ